MLLLLTMIIIVESLQIEMQPLLSYHCHKYIFFRREHKPVVKVVQHYVGKYRDIKRPPWTMFQHSTLRNGFFLQNLIQMS